MKNKPWLNVLAWLVISIPSFALSAPAKITQIKVTSIGPFAQIIIKTTAPTEPRIFTLDHPDRLVVDFPNTQLAMNLKSLTFPNSIIKDVRGGAPVPNVLRLVLDVKDPFKFKRMFSFSPSQIKISVNSAKKGEKPMLILQKSFHPAASKRLIPKNQLTNVPTDHTMVVMIDPGHGGKDTGAIGSSGVLEKNVVLKISKNLAELIDKTPHMRAVLTRNGDYYVTLHNRLVLARKNKADIYISIHADSFLNNWASGASVYALSKNGATSIAARWLAKRDNYSELDDVPLNTLADQSPILRSVLIDLAQTVTVTDSMRLGSALLEAMDNVTALHYSRVEQAPFMVLKSPDIPSVLVETGFISNPKEESRLSNNNYQQKMAVSLFNGIRNFQKKYVIAGV